MGFISGARVPATQWLVASCAVIGLLAGSARAQFDLFEWTAQLPEGSSGFTAEDVMHIEGVELPELSGPSTAAFVTTAPYAGHVVARMSFQNFDLPGYDWPVLIVGRELTVLDTESFDDVIVSFDVAAGGSFGFGVQSDDGLGGPGVVDLEQLMWTPPPVVTKVPGATSTEALGFAVSAIGDLDGDGLPDILAGAPHAVVNGKQSGRVVALSSADGGVIREWSGTVAGDWFGASVAGLPDMNGDAVPDLLVGSPALTGLANQSRVRLLSGADAAVLHTFDFGSSTSYLGRSVAAVGDIDGDGVTEFLFGAPGTDSGGGGGTGQEGKAWLVSGATYAVLDGFLGPGQHAELGTSVAAAGDVDADGTPDLIVGAPLHDTSVTIAWAGYAEVISGATRATLFSVAGDEEGDQLGWAVAGVGDLDGDGHAEFAIGVPYADGDRGQVRVYSGSDFSVMFTLHGGLPGAGFGSTVASAGDVDGDGVPDLLCGAWNWSPFPDAGEVHVFSGRNGLILQHLQGSAGDERLGAALAGLGDLDDDGYGDFAVGAPGNWPPGKAGAVHIVRPRFTLASCGAGLAGARGVPVLQAKGLLTPGKPFTLSLSNAVPNGSALLVVGLSAIHHAFKGGTMVPAVNLLLPGWMTDPAGELQLMTAWPGGLPSATALYLQFWLPDAAGVQGFSASNGVHALTQ